MWASGRKCRRACTRSSPAWALYQFDCPIIFKVFGEMSLYCNVKDVGLVSITGCCHPGDHPLRGHGLQGACLREGSVLRPVRRAAYLALRRLGPEVRRPRHRAQEVEPPAGRLQPLHGTHHRPEVRGRGLSGGEGHGPGSAPRPPTTSATATSSSSPPKMRKYWGREGKTPLKKGPRFSLPSPNPPARNPALHFPSFLCTGSLFACVFTC